MYKLDESLLELYPMGEIIHDNDKRDELRTIKRNELGINDNDILMIHRVSLRTEENENILEALKNVAAKICD